MTVPNDWGLRTPGTPSDAPVDLLFGGLLADMPRRPASAEPVEPPTGDLLDDATEAIGGALEALLLMAEQPMAADTLAEAVDAPTEVVQAVLGELRDFYDAHHRGFELREVAGGWRYYTRAEHAELISTWVVSGQSSRLSQAALETLAVIAYTQPISRSRVSAVRGVNVDGVVRTLLSRDLVAEVGHDPDTGAVLLGTTQYFLQRLGLTRLEDLPPIAPLLPDAAELEAELADLARDADADSDTSVDAGADAEGSASEGRDTGA